jgi:hypothetical protein
MKATITNLIFITLLLLINYKNVTANTWEFSMEVTSNGTTLIGGVPIYLYYVDDVSHGFLTPFR